MTAQASGDQPAAPLTLARKLQPGQRAELHVIDPGTGATRKLFESTTQLFEAPNWSPDGRWIVVNADGLLYRLDVEAPSALEEIPGPGLPELNNDHLISPDGRWHYVSANDGHIYRLPWEGGQAKRVTAPKSPDRKFRHWLHGISPDGQTLAYVGTEVENGQLGGRRALWLLHMPSGDERLLGDGYSVADGPEYSPDGADVYFNSEIASSTPGHAQLFKHNLATGELTQLTSDERVNWFPHVSPDGSRIAYLSYPAGTLGHPANVWVSLRVMNLPAGKQIEVASIFGGQGTLNVYPWSRDSSAFAFVAYPISAG